MEKKGEFIVEEWWRCSACGIKQVLGKEGR